MRDEAQRTVHAQQALELTDVFGYKFGVVSFGNERKWRVKLMEPDGPSTAGGILARQSMVLAPNDADGLVCGWIDGSAKQSEIRSYDFVKRQYEARFKESIDLDRAEYDRLVSELEGFLRIQKIEFRVAEAPPAPVRPTLTSAKPAPRPVMEDGATAPSLLGMLALGIVLGFGLGWIVFAH